MEQMNSVIRAVRRTVLGGVTLLSVAALVGCLGDSPTDSSGQGLVPVSLSVAVPRTVSTPTSVPSGYSITVTDGPNRIVMDRVEIVVRDIVLKPDDVASCGAGDCVRYLDEAAVLPLPTDGGVLRLQTRSVEVARYDRLQVGLHAPSSGSPVLTDNPEFEGVSVRIEGTYNGEAFTFTTDVTAEPEMTLDPALVLGGATPGANVTFLVGVTSWFQSEGGGLIDPRTATDGGENEALVEGNIRSSFQAFRDDDRDGSPGTTGR